MGCHRDGETQGSSVVVRVDVTKIVRCLCITGVLVVGIIFGTKCWSEVQRALGK